MVWPPLPGSSWSQPVTWQLPRQKRASLPDSVTPLVGRADEIEAVVELVRREQVRLVTLTGLGGIGKTRLAVEAARLLARDFSDGVAYVPLATVSDPGLLAARTAQALGVGEAGGPPEEALEEYLRPRRMLLLVDNFEQLVTAADLFSRLLSIRSSIPSAVWIARWSVTAARSLSQTSNTSRTTWSPRV